MNDLTLGQLKDILTWIVAFGTTVGTLYFILMKGFGKLIQPIKDDIRDERIERLKSDLTTFIYIASKDDLSNDQKMRAHEEYDMYIKLGGNSWVHDRFEELKKEGKI